MLSHSFVSHARPHRLKDQFPFLCNYWKSCVSRSDTVVESYMKYYDNARAEYKCVLCTYYANGSNLTRRPHCHHTNKIKTQSHKNTYHARWPFNTYLIEQNIANPSLKANNLASKTNIKLEFIYVPYHIRCITFAFRKLCYSLHHCAATQKTLSTNMYFSSIQTSLLKLPHYPR